GAAEAGADVCIWGTSKDKNAAAAEALRATGGKIFALECDVGDEAAVDAAFAETLRQLGRVDACFANAGVAGFSSRSFTEMTSQEWQRVLR
ncbi:SDR family oxidoreductase, partial [Acinetobacter baumannii]